MEQKEPVARSYTEDIRESSTKALLRGLGLNDKDLKKARIAVIDTWNVIDPAQDPSGQPGGVCKGGYRRGRRSGVQL